MIERYCYLLESKRAVGDVYAESRGKQEDNAIENEFRAIYEDGIIMGSKVFKNAKWVQHYLSGRNIKLKNKEKGIVGLETADFFAKPASLFLLSSFDVKSYPYPTHAVYVGCKDLLKERLYKKNSGGETRGYGLKLLT